MGRLVTDVRFLVVQKESHAEGYRTAIRSMGDIRAFTRIKDATARATLRSMNSATQAAAQSSLKIMDGWSSPYVPYRPVRASTIITYLCNPCS